ncbi:MAG: FAD-dependent oxidoreductase [Sciscionella sp.]
MTVPAVTPVPAGSVERVDHEADVLVIGVGCAGASVAIEAAVAGARVLALEGAGGPGGSSALSGGELYLGGGTSVQRACGFDDTAENMLAYLTAALGPHADEEKLRLYCEGSVEHFEWLCAQGLEFQESRYDAPSWMPPTTDGLMWLGENAWPYNTIAHPVPRGHRPKAESFGGWLLMAKLTESTRSSGVDIHTDTRASTLVVDGDRVVGVLARRYGKQVSYRARRAVVITTGGFVDNAEMLADHAPRLLGHGAISGGSDDGSGIRMATALGASTRRMAAAQVALTALPAMVCRGMLVNAHGQRFVNEDVYPGMYSMAAVFHQPGPWWAIIDEAGYEDIPERDRWGVRLRFAAETLAGLEAELGMPAGALRSTVDTYNRFAAVGEDPYFHKDPKWLRPLRSPFAAVDPRAGFGGGRDTAGTGACGFTLGGLHTTVDGLVLDVSGRPIPGLLAAGRASSGIHGEGYVSGTSLGDGTFFGRRAGRAAAA